MYFSGIGYADADNCFINKEASFNEKFDHASMKAADLVARGAAFKDIPKLCEVTYVRNGGHLAQGVMRA